MARRERGNHMEGKWFSCKRIMLIVSFINVAIVVHVLLTLYTSVYSFAMLQAASHYSPHQIRKMDESNQIRKASQPTKLIKTVTQLSKELFREENVTELPQHLKQKIADEILARLRSLNADADESTRRDIVDGWRKEKLKEANRLVTGKRSNSTTLLEESGIIARAVDFQWDKLSEDIGLWIPVQIVNEEHDDKPEGEEEFDSGILPGRQLPPKCHAEVHTDYDGTPIRLGLTHHKESAYECCMACLHQARRAKQGEKKCNIWVYCPSETGCYSPDRYEHMNEECWLKYSKKPKLNVKGRYSECYRNEHPNAPPIVPWVSGVVSSEL